MELQPFKYRILFSANVGSHMWKMDHEKSDFDVLSVFVFPTEDILLGKKPNNKSRKYGNIDEQLMEVGHFIEQLKKCNINAIWCMLSPTEVFDPCGLYKELRYIVERNLSQLVFNSLNGLARSNMKKFVDKADHESAKYKKKSNIIARTLNFGIKLLRYAEYDFNPYHVDKEEDLHDMLLELERAKNFSCLPEKPNFPEEYDKFLLNIRYNNILINELKKYNTNKENE